MIHEYNTKYLDVDVLIEIYMKGRFTNCDISIMHYTISCVFDTHFGWFINLFEDKVLLADFAKDFIEQHFNDKLQYFKNVVIPAYKQSGYKPTHYDYISIDGEIINTNNL